MTDEEKKRIRLVTSERVGWGALLMDMAVPYWYKNYGFLLHNFRMETCSSCVQGIVFGRFRSQKSRAAFKKVLTDAEPEYIDSYTFDRDYGFTGPTIPMTTYKNYPEFPEVTSTDHRHYYWKCLQREWEKQIKQRKEGMKSDNNPDQGNQGEELAGRTNIQGVSEACEQGG